MATDCFTEKPLNSVTVEIEKGFLRLFAKVIGETNPIYFEEQAAQAPIQLQLLNLLCDAMQ